jgi:hypothetical protein
MSHVIPKAFDTSVVDAPVIEEIAGQSMELKTADVKIQPAPDVGATVRAAVLLHPFSNEDIFCPMISTHTTRSTEASDSSEKHI